jgi:hypothetical protein
MLRLAHRLLTLPIQCAADAHTAAWQRQNRIVQLIREQLRRDCPIIIADNVAEYVYGDPDAAFYDAEAGVPGVRFSFAHLGCLLPPFNVFFIEWRESLAWQKRWPGGAPATGWLIHPCDPDKKCLEVLPEARHVLVCLHSFEQRNGQPAVSGYTRQFAIDAEGNYLGTTRREIDESAHNAASTAFVALQTIGFMNCRNVEKVDATATEGPTAKWCRRQRVPALTYRVIQIDAQPSRKKRCASDCAEGGGPSKALHICRGHFAHYVDDGVSQGLFGRGQFGTFWVPSHTRGSLEHGRVVSTYNVNVPCNS